MEFKKIIAIAGAVITAAMLGGCATTADTAYETELPNETYTEVNEQQPEAPTVVIPDPEEQPTTPVPQIKTVSYVNITGSGVCVRSGAGTDYAVLGTVQSSTRYAYLGKTGSWYKINYRNKTAFVSANYSEIVSQTAGDDRIEAVISEGAKLLGSTYVYGATRYHSGNGKLLSGFNVNEFDCSSLMQYVFKKGADVNLQVNTRTQVKQGVTVPKSELKRGDLMFFTNSSRKNNTGLERIGHVGLYLGDGYMLHTANSRDNARIEKISATWQSYFIQAQRMI